MTRLYFAIGLLVGLLLLGIVTAVLMPRYHLPVAQALRDAAVLCREGRTEDALASFRNARALWEKHRHLTASICDHAPQDEMDALFEATMFRGEIGMWDEFGAACSQMAVMAEDMARLHGLSLSQIL